MLPPVSPEEFEEYQRLSQEPVQDGDVDGQRRKTNAIYWVAYCFCFEEGGVGRDKAAAVSLLDQIIQAQDSNAQGNIEDMTGKHRCLLALLYGLVGFDRGDLAQQLYQQAVPRLQFEVQVVDGLNLRETAFHLCRCFNLGLGVERDEEQMMFWWKRGAELGDVNAQTQFHSFYFSIHRSAQARDGIMDWWRQLATEQEQASAQFCLGECYEEGKGVERDPISAVEWYDKAIAQHDTDATDAKRNLLATLNVHELNRVLGCVKRNQNIKKANQFVEQPPQQIPLGLWSFAMGAFQHEDNPPWEAPSPTFLVFRAVAPQLKDEFPIPKKRAHPGK